MSLIKRGKTWHTHFFVDSQRFRQSLETGDWREAQAKEKDLIAQASQGKLAPASQQFSRLSLNAALDRYLADRSAQVTERSHRSESDHAKPLRSYFGNTPVSRINADMLLALVRDRKGKGISNTTVNMEIGIMRRVLKRAKRWHMVADEIPHLPERRDIGRALAPNEKLGLLKVAAMKPEWETAYLASVLALNTTMRGCEIKQLRWRDIDLMGRSLTILRSKTRAGERVIPLNVDAYGAILRLRERAQQSFGPDPQLDWYVFPHAEGFSLPDPTKPVSGWRSAWRSLTRAAGLKGLRFHDLRHHAITELAESQQASDSTIMAIAGHVSSKMLQHYSHVRIQAKRTALDALSTRRGEVVNLREAEGGYDTNAWREEPFSSQVIEKNGGVDGTRTRGLCRDSVAPLGFTTT